MANRKDWYYRQKVLEDELEGSDNSLEEADQAVVSDLGMGKDEDNAAEYGGVCWGFTASNPSGLGVKLESGAAHDASGRRCYTDDDYTVTLSNIGDVAIGAGGVPAGASALPASGYERWATIFIVYDRLLSDNRYDGYNDEVYFERAESFHFSVSVGVEKTNGSLLVSDKPARETGKVLLCDARLRNTGGTTAIYSFDQDREEIFFRVTATGGVGTTIARAKLRDVLKDLLEHYNDHVSGLENKHPASDITLLGGLGTTWADGTGGATGAATDVQAALTGIVADLKATTEVAGAKRIGAKAQTGALATPAMAALSFSGGTLESQLTAVLAALNGRIFRGGDSGIGGALTPAVDGTDLGTTSFSWDAFLKDIEVKGAINSNLVPGNDSTRSLGLTGTRWLNLYVDNITMGGTLTLEATASINAGATMYFDNGLVAKNLQVEDGPTTLFVKDATDGFTLQDQLTADPKTGGWLARVRSHVIGNPGDFLRISKFGDIFAGPVFYDNFQSYAARTSSDLNAHVGPRWRLVANTYTDKQYFVSGLSELRHLAVLVTSGEPSSKYFDIRGGEWAVGLLQSTVCSFTVGFHGTVCGANEQLRVGLFGTIEATVVINNTQAVGFFYNGTSNTTGANLLSGAPAANTPYTFRIAILSNNTALFMGPNGAYILTPATGSMSGAATAEFQFYGATVTGNSTTWGASLYEVYVNEQAARDLD